MPGTCNLVYETFTDLSLVVSCQNRELPTEVEWGSWLAAVAGLHHKVGNFRLLVVTEGGHPTRPQLERLRAANRTNPPTAIVSSSRAYRFMATALTFINPTIRCFAPEEEEAAFDHIGLDRQVRERVRNTVLELQQRLGPVAE